MADTQYVPKKESVYYKSWQSAQPTRQTGELTKKDIVVTSPTPVKKKSSEPLKAKKTSRGSISEQTKDIKGTPTPGTEYETIKIGENKSLQEQTGEKDRIYGKTRGYGEIYVKERGVQVIKESSYTDFEQKSYTTFLGRQIESPTKAKGIKAEAKTRMIVPDVLLGKEGTGTTTFTAEKRVDFIADTGRPLTLGEKTYGLIEPKVGPYLEERREKFEAKKTIIKDWALRDRKKEVVANIMVRQYEYRASLPEEALQNLPKYSLIGGVSAGVGFASTYIANPVVAGFVGIGGASIAIVYGTVRGSQIITGTQDPVLAYARMRSYDWGLHDYDRAEISGQAMAKTTLEIGSAVVGAKIGVKAGQWSQSWGRKDISGTVETKRIDISDSQKKYYYRREAEIVTYKKGAYTVEQTRVGKNVRGTIKLGKKTVGTFKYTQEPRYYTEYDSVSVMRKPQQMSMTDINRDVSEFYFTQQGSQTIRGFDFKVSPTSTKTITVQQALNIVQTSQYIGTSQFSVSPPKSGAKTIVKDWQIVTGSEYRPILEPGLKSSVKTTTGEGTFTITTTKTFKGIGKRASFSASMSEPQLITQPQVGVGVESGLVAGGSSGFGAVQLGVGRADTVIASFLGGASAKVGLLPALLPSTVLQASVSPVVSVQTAGISANLSPVRSGSRDFTLESSKTLVEPTSAVTPIISTGVRTGTSSITSPSVIPTPPTGPGTGVTPPPQIVPPPILGFPKLGLPRPEFGRGRGRKDKRKVKGKTQYTPSIEAILFNIRGKKSRRAELTGLGIRPIPT